MTIYTINVYMYVKCIYVCIYTLNTYMHSSYKVAQHIRFFSLVKLRGEVTNLIIVN